nr:uncharacterized protein LOC117861974 [Setaria viridis]
MSPWPTQALSQEVLLGCWPNVAPFSPVWSGAQSTRPTERRRRGAARAVHRSARCPRPTLLRSPSVSSFAPLAGCLVLRGAGRSLHSYHCSPAPAPAPCKPPRGAFGGWWWRHRRPPGRSSAAHSRLPGGAGVRADVRARPPLAQPLEVGHEPARRRRRGQVLGVRVEAFWDSCDLRTCNCEFCDNSYSISDGTRGKRCVLLKGLSEAKHLALSCEPQTFILKRDLRWCPMFSKLKTLLLDDYWCAPDDFRALVCILENSPVLEKLTLELSSEV